MQKFLLYGIFTKAANMSPWIYILSYIIIIFGFGFLYHCRSREFYHPYVRFEWELSHEADTVRQLLTSKFKDMARSQKDTIPNITVVPDEVQVEGIRPDGHLLYVWIHVRIEVQTKQGKAVSITQIPYKFSSHSLVVKFDVNGHETYQLLGNIDRSENWNEFKPFASLIDNAEKAESDLEYMFAMPELEQTAFRHILALQQGTNGFPSQIEGSYGRMLYLSTVTITTLGYGDIVPLTWQTRLLTGVEATLGIVLLGLFVSSMASVRDKV